MYADSSISLPYSSSFFDNVPVHFLNLDALIRGGTELRDFRKDCYWSVSAGSGVFTRLIFRQGKPYYIAGSDCLDSDSFLAMIRNDKRELFLSLNFLDDHSLGPVIKYLTEEPVLTELDNSSGELVQLLKSLRKSGESGMISLHVEKGIALIPICEGRISRGFLPGRTIAGRGLVEFLKSPEGSGMAEFFDGPVAEPAALGIGEINLILHSVNVWLESLGPVWPQSRSLMPGYVEKIRERYSSLEPLNYEIGEGLSLSSFIAESDDFPKAMATLVKSLCKKHPSPATALKLFTRINSERATALEATGLTRLL
ncbi:hypothetical protein CSA37_06835 [Candidatus Fermentibacteria bacterium]|nr:MAG: hypothetical protein CSA37_06835 [Candidatus Fermentibacteria bacterium]